MRDLAIGIDVGTTGVKGVVVSSKGKIVATTSRRCDLISPKPGFAEEDPNVWHKNVLEILKEFSVFKDRISSIGISGMVPTLILIDSEGNPLGNSIQQNDSRAVKEIDYFKKVLDEEKFFRVTGNTINQQLIFPKFLWLRKNRPKLIEKARWIMGSYNYINFKLTGVPNLEKNWALESGLWKIDGGWYEDVLKVSGISENMLPRVYDPWKVIGYLKEDVSRVVGLSSGIPVIAGSADHIASALSTGLNRDGDLLLKFGGAGDVLYVSKTLRLSKKLFIDYHDIPGMYVPNGCMASSGSIVKWFANEFTSLSYEELTSLARDIPPGSEGLVALPYFIGEKTPIFDPKARGVFVGISTHHTKAHIFRAILESVAYGFRHHVEVLEEEGFKIKRVFMSNGGAKNELWREIVADAVGKDAIYILNNPGSSLGAAFIAGKATGVFKDWEDIDLFTKERVLVKHNPKRKDIYDKFYEIYREIYENLKETFKKIHNILEG